MKHSNKFTFLLQLGNDAVQADTTYCNTELLGERRIKVEKKKLEKKCETRQ
jgi:hypothetical protein